MRKTDLWKDERVKSTMDGWTRREMSRWERTKSRCLSLYDFSEAFSVVCVILALSSLVFLAGKEERKIGSGVLNHHFASFLSPLVMWCVFFSWQEERREEKAMICGHRLGERGNKSFPLSHPYVRQLGSSSVSQQSDRQRDFLNCSMSLLVGNLLSQREEMCVNESPKEVPLSVTLSQRVRETLMREERGAVVSPFVVFVFPLAIILSPSLFSKCLWKEDLKKQDDSSVSQMCFFFFLA